MTWSKKAREVSAEARKKTAKHRIIARAKAANTTGQIEDQTQRINADTDRMFQEAANYHRKIFRNAGKIYRPK